MKKNLFLLLLAFTSGYLLRHNTVPPPFLTSNQVLSSMTGLPPNPGSSPLVNRIEYKNGTFIPDSLSIHQSDYILIVNKSEDNLMWLDSNYPKLNTKRGFRYLEQIKIRLDEPGDFTVTNKLNLRARLSIRVSE
jgi:hypothetical protein